MARFLYCILLYLATPLVWLRLIWRSRRQPEYRKHLSERWGYYPGKPASRLLWVHAVSVGETRAAQPLIEGLLAAYPEHGVLLTCMTPTGRETGLSVYGERVQQAYLPYDYPGAVSRFFRHFQPSFGVLMETEIWPNLLQAAEKADVPVILVNARLSDRSAKGYGRFSRLVAPAFSSLAACAAQTQADADRLKLLGVREVTVCGNLKFDVAPSSENLALGEQWRTALGNRPVWLAASTREGEEALILDALAELAVDHLLLVLVPRHPQRFAEVAELVHGRGWSQVKRSAGLPSPDTQVWLGDSMGEMAAYYAMADLTFIGGSLLPLGGQNLIEAAACACPVVIGPYTFNFAQASADAVNAGAALQVQDAASLRRTVQRLLDTPQELSAMKAAALAFSSAHQGASRKTLEVIERFRGPARH